jgi:hypothetical protein
MIIQRVLDLDLKVIVFFSHPKPRETFFENRVFTLRKIEIITLLSEDNSKIYSVRPVNVSLF